MGETGYLSSVAAFLAEALYEQGADDEARRFTYLSERAAASDDVWTQILFRSTRAKLLARGGATDRAEPLARQAVALASRTDALELHGNALLALAEVLRRVGRTGEAAGAAEEAVALYERKGNVVTAKRARAALQLSLHE
jgi:ATP/maltotriose-dependent transcriptional regulator MalT